jgi:outer membrane immunogenic protein
MLRKMLLAAAAFGFAASAAAADFAGPYVGAGLTHDNVGGSGDLDGVGANGTGGSLFAGYNLPVKGGFVGVEGNVDLNTADASDIETKWGYGVGVRAGLNLSSETVAYARAGYQRSKADVVDQRGWGDGVRLGVGLEAALSETASLRVEYNHVDYVDVLNHQAVFGVVFGF